MIRIYTNPEKLQSVGDDLEKIRKKTIPYAIRQCLNKAAYETSKYAKERLDETFILRNKYVERSIQYRRAEGLRIENMESQAGAILPFMEQQEQGFRQRGTGHTGGVTIPTSAAGNQPNAKIRTKKQTKRNMMKEINLSRLRKGNLLTIVKVIDAVKSGKREIFLDEKSDNYGRPSGIYRVIGGGKRTKRGWPKGAKLRMLHSLHERSVTVQPHQWLKKAFNKVSPNMIGYYADAFSEQLNRFN